MDLGIAGKNAIVCGASKGLGYGCAESLVREGVNVFINGRTADTVSAAVAKLNAIGRGKASGVVADVTTEAGRAAALAACPQPDILVTNAGGPPAGDFRTFKEGDWLAAIQANMLTPIALINATVEGMIARKFGRIVNITSSQLLQASEILPLSNGARAGLTAAIAGLSRTIAQHNVTINNILPGLFDTDRGRSTAQGIAKQRGITLEEALAIRTQSIPAKRMGTAQEFGEMCAFLCSAQAAYITGQNMLIDGGAFPGVW